MFVGFKLLTKMATNQTIGIAAASVTINDFTVLAQIRSELKATKKMV